MFVASTHVQCARAAAEFLLSRGEEDRTEFRFNTGEARHRFCRDSIERGTFDRQNWEKHVDELASAK